MRFSLYIFIPIVFGLFLSVDFLKSWELFLFLLICFISFNIGYYVTGNKYLDIKMFPIKKNFFEIILLVFLLYFFIDFYLMTNTFYIEFNTISLYRSMLTNEMESHKLPFIFISYSSYYAFVFYLLFFWSKLDFKKYIYVTLLLYFALLSSGRSTMIISFLIITVYLINIFSSKKKIFLISILAIASYFLFNLYGEMLGKVGEGFGITNYFTAPCKALNQIFYNNPILVRPDYNLTFLPIRAAIDPINYSPIVPYLTTPIEVNAFTLVGVFLNDFGYWGTLFSFCLIGTGVRLFKNRTVKRLFGASLSINILSVMLLLSCFHDYLTTSVSLILLIIIFQFVKLNTYKFVRN